MQQFLSKKIIYFHLNFNFMENQILIELLSQRIELAELEFKRSTRKTQIEFAKKIGISPAALRQIKAKTYEVSFKMLYTICNRLNWNTQDFIEIAKSESQIGNYEKIEITENDKTKNVSAETTADKPKETIQNRENLLIQLGRAQGEAKAYRDALKDSTLYYFQKIDNSFNVLIDLVKEKKIEQPEKTSPEPAPGKTLGEHSQGRVKTTYRPVVPRGEDA
jgi:DNA-binding Xre family transcriptional regulator